MAAQVQGRRRDFGRVSAERGHVTDCALKAVGSSASNTKEGKVIVHRTLKWNASNLNG